jgi:hypothetical protein
MGEGSLFRHGLMTFQYLANRDILSESETRLLRDETSHALTSCFKVSSSLFIKSKAIKADGRADGSTDQHCTI